MSSGNIKLKIAVDDSQVSKIDKAQRKLEGLNSRNKVAGALTKGSNAINGLGGSQLGGGLGKGLGNLSGFASRLGGVTKLLGPVGAGFSAIAGAATLFVSTLNSWIEKGKRSFDDFEVASAKTRVQSRSYAPGIDSGAVVKYFEVASENGVASLDHLVSTFNNLLPVINGNVEEAKELTVLLADMEAAGHGSADSYTQMIAAIRERGDVEERDLKRMERQGLPIYRELAKVRQEEEVATRKAVKAGKVSADEFVSSLKQVAEAYKGTAAELSATTEGAKASMEAARGRAYRGAASGAGDALKDYYMTEQQRYDLMADDTQLQREQYENARLWQHVANLWENAGTRIMEFFQNQLPKVLKYVPGLGQFTARDKLKEITVDYEAARKRVQEARETYNSKKEKGTANPDDYLELMEAENELRQIVKRTESWQGRERRKYEHDEWWVDFFDNSAWGNASEWTAKNIFQHVPGLTGLSQDYLAYLELSRANVENWGKMDKDRQEQAELYGLTESPHVGYIGQIEGMYADAREASNKYHQELAELEEQRRQEAKQRELYIMQAPIVKTLQDTVWARMSADNKERIMDGELNRFNYGEADPRDYGLENYINYDEAGNFAIDFKKIANLAEDKMEKVRGMLEGWITENIYEATTSLQTTFERFGVYEGYGIGNAQDFIETFDDKVKKLYARISDLAGEERLVKASEALRELFNANGEFETEEELTAALEGYVEIYNTLIKSINETEKTARDYIDSEIKKIEEEEKKILERRRDTQAKRIEEEQWTKSDSYNSLASYKRRLEQAKDSKGKNLYSDNRVMELVRMMGNKMLDDAREAKKDARRQDEGRWTNMHRADAPAGYIGTTVAGYRLRDENAAKTNKELKDANKNLREIKQAIDDVDKTPRAV